MSYNWSKELVYLTLKPFIWKRLRDFSWAQFWYESKWATINLEPKTCPSPSNQRQLLDSDSVWHILYKVLTSCQSSYEVLLSFPFSSHYFLFLLNPVIFITFLACYLEKRLSISKSFKWESAEATAYKVVLDWRSSGIFVWKEISPIR